MVLTKAKGRGRERVLYLCLLEKKKEGPKEKEEEEEARQSDPRSVALETTFICIHKPSITGQTEGFTDGQTDRHA